MTFVPHLYIGVGETGAFFTLRETYLHEFYVGRTRHTEVRSHHHFNLSQDADEAFEKARAFAERNLIALNTTREQLTEQMRDIQRANAEERERRERVAREREEAWAEERRQREEAQRALILSGKFAFGPYELKEFEKAPRGYLTWLAKTLTDFEEGSLMRLTAEEVARRCADLLLPDPHPTLTVGEPKKRLTFEVVVTRVRWFDRESYTSYGRLERVYIVTMVDKATGACLLSRSACFAPEEGKELTIKGTVKEHSDYRNQAQTVLQRIAVLGK